MEHTKLSLTTWFLAICLISQAKTGLLALALKRRIGLSYPTAWLLHRKINLAMAARLIVDIAWCAPAKEQVVRQHT